MKFIADFHIHSKYSRAVSQEMNVESLDKWARIKGIKVLGTGDFTHPQWLAELKEKLEPAEPGLYKLKMSAFGGSTESGKNNEKFINKKDESNESDKNKTRFILTSEISSIYSKNGRGRRIHNIIFASSFDVVDKINTQLSWIGNLKSDGRPILGLDSEELLKIILNISEDCFLVPAHAWTPWFGVFGSQSGFDSLKECFGDWTKYIYAIETGLSSDPAMNWRWSALDNITLISNSDAHSPANLGREANIFEGEELSYQAIIEAIKLGVKTSQNSQALKLISTTEFFPQEGKYHFDGHRNCQIVFSPKETKEHKNICPKCGKPLTIGVMNRVEKLADRPEGGKPEKVIPFKCLVPLQEIIADAFGMGKASKTVQEEYKKMVINLGNEFEILLDKSKEEIESVTPPLIAEGIIRVREEKVKIHPGYDGEFGKIKIFSLEEKEGIKKGNSIRQKSLL
jgi:uncharacterized protein (TIGR00375 family)